MKRLAIFVVWLLASAGCSWADQRYPATGMLLKVEPSHGSFVVSCQNIPATWMRWSCHSGFARVKNSKAWYRVSQ